MGSVLGCGGGVMKCGERCGGKGKCGGEMWGSVGIGVR